MINNKQVHVRYYQTKDGNTGLYFTDQEPREEMSEEIPEFDCWTSPWEKAEIKDTDGNQHGEE